MSLASCRVVLVQPHYPGNIGATARVMANMGLCELVLVDPVADPRDPQALAMSTHGESILDSVRIVSDFASAVADCALVVATSARSGGIFRRQTVAEPDAILPTLVAALREGAKTAVVFGPEPTGLSSEMTSRCHYLIHIPTVSDHASLNLAQAVAICLYELRQAWLHAEVSELSSDTTPCESLAGFDDQERCFQHLEVALREIGYLFGSRAEALMHAIRHLLGRAKLTPMEVRVLMGLARQIRWFAEKKNLAGSLESTEVQENEPAEEPE